MKRLIVNADDFGFTRDVNEGIVEAHRHGILTACTLMANGDAFEHAVALSRETPSLDVGCHLVFVQGRSVLDSSRELPVDLKALAYALARRRLPLYEEAVAQVQKLISAGIHPTHIDTHKHTQLAPSVLSAVARVARQFGVDWVRRPVAFRSRLHGLRTTDHFTGFRLTGKLDEDSLGQALGSLQEGLTEFMCHPGRLGSELKQASTRLKQSRQIELEALLSLRVRALIERHGIRLTDYRSL